MVWRLRHLCIQPVCFPEDSGCWRRTPRTCLSCDFISLILKRISMPEVSRASGVFASDDMRAHSRRKHVPESCHGHNPYHKQGRSAMINLILLLFSNLMELLYYRHIKQRQNRCKCYKQLEMCRCKCNANVRYLFIGQSVVNDVKWRNGTKTMV